MWYVCITPASVPLLLSLSPPSQNLVCAMGPPGGGRNHITNRFTRHFNLISIESFDDTTMTKIFSSMADWHFSKGFDPTFLRLGKVFSQSLSSGASIHPLSVIADDGASNNVSVQSCSCYIPTNTFQISLCLQLERFLSSGVGSSTGSQDTHDRG